MTLGYDPLATDTVDAAFGEVNLINSLWNGDLDVRIGDKSYTWIYGANYDSITWDNDNSYLSKKQILKSYCDTYEKRSAEVTIQFKATQLPLTIKWDKTNFKYSSCRDLSVIYFRGFEDMAPPEFFGQAYPLGSYDSITIHHSTLNGQPIWDASPGYNFKVQTYLHSGDTIGAFKFIFLSENSPYAENGLPKIDPGQVQIFPNPTQDNLKIDLSQIWEPGNWQITLIQDDGKIVQSTTIKNAISKLNISHLSNGMYNLIIQNPSGYKTMMKINKNNL